MDTKEKIMAFELPDLPFAYDALDPVMSAETFEYHHDKHHAAYVANGNKLLDGSGLEGKSLEEIVIAADKAGNGGLFNNAAQHWNHSFFWNCLKPNGGGTSLPAALQAKIDSDLGGYEEFKAKFTEACVTQFGSGWGWLTMDNATGKLEITKTGNAGVPFTEGKTPLLTCDVWEHAYYIDYRNARPKFVETFVDQMINWDFVAANLEQGPLKIAA
jgi:Fe-Mn family superoxide dismutase